MNQAVEMVNEVEVVKAGKPTFMQRVLRKMGKEEKGFTLIELLAVLVIVAIIAVIAIPLIGGIINNSKSDSDVATARQVYDASRLYITGEKAGNFTGAGTVNVVGADGTDTLQGKKYVDTPLLLPSNKQTVSSGTVVYNTSGQLTSVTLVTTGQTREYTAAQILDGKAR